MKHRFAAGLVICFAAAVCLASCSDSNAERVPESKTESGAVDNKVGSPETEVKTSDAGVELQLDVSDMRTEYHVRPIGMDEPKPRFSYTVQPIPMGGDVPMPEFIPPKHQTARRIHVKETKTGREVSSNRSRPIHGPSR